MQVAVSRVVSNPCRITLDSHVYLSYSDWLNLKMNVINITKSNMPKHRGITQIGFRVLQEEAYSDNESHDCYYSHGFFSNGNKFSAPITNHRNLNDNEKSCSM